MQDRFKFRVFAPLIQSYTYFDLDNIIKVNTDYVVQQCIGVKDKTDRLIYEGDVVKWEVFESTKYFKKETIKPSLGELKWYCNASFRVKQLTIGYANYSDLECEDLDGEESLHFYCQYEGYQEFNWNELEVIASVADNKLIALEGNVISTLTTTEDTLKLLNLV